MLHEPLRAVGRQSTLLHAVQHGGVSCMGVTNPSLALSGCLRGTPISTAMAVTPKGSREKRTFKEVQRGTQWTTGYYPAPPMSSPPPGYTVPPHPGGNRHQVTVPPLGGGGNRTPLPTSQF